MTPDEENTMPDETTAIVCTACEGTGYRDDDWAEDCPHCEDESQGDLAVECIGTCGYNAADRESAMVVVERADDGTPTVWCDPCLEPLVRALNDAGLRTVASCCGHRQRPGQIALADGRELFIAPDFDMAQAISRAFPTDINGDPLTDFIRAGEDLRGDDNGSLEAR